jgi:putative oxidoreductase
MSKLETTLTLWAPRALAILRIMTGLLYIQHGTQKLFDFPARASGGGGDLSSFMLLTGVLEAGGGTLFAIGLFTRPVAFILSGMMAVAYFMAHAPQGFFPINNRGDLAILFCFVYLYFVCTGAGPWSIDAMMKRQKAAV